MIEIDNFCCKSVEKNMFMYYVLWDTVIMSYKQAVFTEVVIYAHIHAISNNVMARNKKSKCWQTKPRVVFLLSLKVSQALQILTLHVFID